MVNGGPNSAVIPGRGEASNPESGDDWREIPGSRLRAPRNDDKLFLRGENPVAPGLQSDDIAGLKLARQRRWPMKS
jgi:hypothetical protein